MKSFKKLREKTLTPAEKKKREEIAKAMERDNPGMDMSKKMAIATATAKKVAEASKSDMLCKECGDQFGKPTNEKCMYDAYDQSGKNWVTKEMYEGLDITEISLDMLTKKISNSGMATTKKANKMDKIKDDLAAMKARLAGKPAMAKEAYEDDEPASPDEASMAMRQLGFIEYAAEEVMDHIKSGKEFPEWMQNKLSKLHGQMESLYSALGDHGEDDEEMKEATELDELSKKTLGSYYKAANQDLQKRGSSLRKTDDSTNKFRSRLKYAAKAKYKSDRMDEEATELDELSKKTLGSYVKKASRDVANRSADNARDYATGNRPVGMNKKGIKNWKRKIGIDMAIDKMTKEATELDELNKKTLGSYIKKASGSAAGIAAVTSAQAAIKGKSNPDDRRQLRNRLTGISRATDKVTKEEVELDEGSRDIKQPGPHPDMVKAGIKHTHLQSPFKRSKTYVTVDKKDHAKAKKVLGNQTVENGGNVYLEIKEGAPKMTSTQRSLASLRNEAVMSADKKPEKFVKPDGTVGIRMIRGDNQVIKKDA